MPTNERPVDALGDEPRRPQAFRELMRRGPAAVPDIRRGLTHSLPKVREECCRLLDRLLVPGAVDDLTAMLDAPDARVRVAALHDPVLRPVQAGRGGLPPRPCRDPAARDPDPAP